MKQLLILSGKGGTGKTTISSSFIKLSETETFADCDVDAPNLHLLVRPEAEEESTAYLGMPQANINTDTCIGCGLCMENCRFDAISNEGEYKVKPFSCEGCGVCEMLCPAGAISLKPATAGELILYKDHRVFSTAKLKMGSGNSGKLVTEVKKQMKDSAGDVLYSIIDGSPGIGCPVIASLTGVDLVLIVAEPSVSGISDMKRILAAAGQLGVKAAVCVNKYDINNKKYRDNRRIMQGKSHPFYRKNPL